MVLRTTRDRLPPMETIMQTIMETTIMGIITPTVMEVATIPTIIKSRIKTVMVSPDSRTDNHTVLPPMDSRGERSSTEVARGIPTSIKTETPDWDR